MLWVRLSHVLEEKISPKIFSLLGMQMFVAAWDVVTAKAVVNCFWKSKISIERQKAAIAEDENPFKELEKETENLRSIQPDLVSENIDAASVTDVDVEVLAVQSLPPDTEIVAEMLEMEDVSNDDNTTQKMKFSIKEFFSKCDQICGILRI